MSHHAMNHQQNKMSKIAIIFIMQVWGLILLENLSNYDYIYTYKYTLYIYILYVLFLHKKSK